MKRLLHEIEICLRARVTFIFLPTSEDERIVGHLKDHCLATKRNFVVWDHADFFQAIVGPFAANMTAKDPISALEAIDAAQGDGIFLLRDFHQCWKNQPRVVRKLRNVLNALRYSRKSIIVTAPGTDIPLELKSDAVILDVVPPDTDELNAILDHLASSPGVRTNLSPPEREKLLKLSLGLNASQAQRVFSKAFITDGALDINDLEIVAREKADIIRESGALQYFRAKESIGDVGGLESLKTWLRQRELAFSDAAQKYGLPTPKGIALIGIPGTGKSLSAKMVSNLWGLPLVQLDVGALFGGLVGESEANTRKAISLAESLAPCVLWIDELEKALAVGEGDGGTGQRVLGKLLGWMQDKEEAVFIVATANNIERLPPELLRRGRFDEIFFLDLPHLLERKEIFAVHLRKRGRDPAKFDLERLAQTAEGYVGAEIEQAVIDGLFRAYADEAQPAREVTDADILAALSEMVPMSRAQAEHIAFLRSWVTEGRAKSASKAEMSYVKGRPADQEFMPLQVPAGEPAGEPP